MCCQAGGKLCQSLPGCTAHMLWSLRGPWTSLLVSASTLTPRTPLQCHRQCCENIMSHFKPRFPGISSYADPNSILSQTAFMAVMTLLWTAVLLNSKRGSDGHQAMNVKVGKTQSAIKETFEITMLFFFCWWFYVWMYKLITHFVHFTHEQLYI